MVAFTSEAAEYVSDIGLEPLLATGCEVIPNIERGGLISDSGADDVPRFLNKQDEQLHLKGITKLQKAKFGLIINRETTNHD